MRRRDLLSLGLSVLHLLALVALLAVPGKVAAPPPEEDLLAKADRLFEQQRWSEARAGYDDASGAASDWRTEAARKVIQRTITCSLRLNEWEDAWQRVDRFRRQAAARPFERNRWHQSNTRDEEAAEARRALEHFELTRELLQQLIAHLQARPNEATPERLRRANTARIEVDFTLVDCLIGEGFDTRHSWARDHDWWWAVSDPLDQSQDDTEGDWWYQQRGVPLAPDGRPQFVTAPERYAAGLGPGAKTLERPRPGSRLRPRPLLPEPPTFQQGGRRISGSPEGVSPACARC
jgi:hypothetical protein